MPTLSNGPKLERLDKEATLTHLLNEIAKGRTPRVNPHEPGEDEFPTEGGAFIGAIYELIDHGVVDFNEDGSDKPRFTLAEGAQGKAKAHLETLYGEKIEHLVAQLPVEMRAAVAEKLSASHGNETNAEAIEEAVESGPVHGKLSA